MMVGKYLGEVNRDLFPSLGNSASQHQLVPSTWELAQCGSGGLWLWAGSLGQYLGSPLVFIAVIKHHRG